MKAPHRFLRTLAVSALVAPLSALAHPGHDGDHDFAWDFSHLVEHPFATFFCFAVLSAAGVLIWRSIRSSHPQPKSKPADPS